MKRGDYMIALHEALVKAGLSSQVVQGDQMTSVAMHLPTAVLKAVIYKQVMYDETSATFEPKSGAVPFPLGWLEACDDELTDRILTENLDEGKE